MAEHTRLSLTHKIRSFVYKQQTGEVSNDSSLEEAYAITCKRKTCKKNVFIIYYLTWLAALFVISTGDYRSVQTPWDTMQVSLTCDGRRHSAAQGGDGSHGDFLTAVLGGAGVSGCDHVGFQ